MDALFERYAAPSTSEGTNAGTDKNGYHTYADTYERLFEGIKDEVTVVLELGVDSGASLMVWADYFENARIIGVDITVQYLRFTHPRVCVLQGDATNGESLVALKHASFDIVIDDASHVFEDQIAAVRWWGPRVRHYMVVEDVMLTTERQRVFQELADEVGMTCSIRDIRGPGLPDDNVLVIFAPRKKSLCT